MSETQTAAADGGREWPMRLAVVFVLLTLVSLVTIPWLVQRRVQTLRARIDGSEPARTLVMQWQFDLVREMAALGDLLLTGDSSQIGAYAAAWSEERAIYRKLAPLAMDIGPEVTARLREARALADRWHGRVNEEDLRRQREAGVRLVEIPREQPLFQEVLLAVAAVDSAIVSQTTRIRREIVSAEVTGLRTMMILGLLALLAALAVVGLHSRVRRFAAEAEHRRWEADQALAETARTMEARNRLLRGITHDVKNPLGAAKGYAELLAMGVKAPLAPEQAPLVEGVERSIDSALAIIADLLDLARVESGTVRVNRVQVDLNDLAREAVRDHLGSADAVGHTLEAEPADQPLTAYTDPARVRQVLDNLISNALKYTPAPGRIAVSVGSPPDGVAPAPGAWATIAVSDTGPGVPIDHRDAIFEEFTRLDESGSKGHGLGLAVSRALARQLGGDLTLEEPTGAEGATFVLWIAQRE